MMLDYLLRLLLLVPIVGGMAFGTLWLWRKLQPGLALRQGEKSVRIVDAVPMGATGRLAVVEFGGKHLLVAVSRGQITLLSEAEASSGDGDD